MKMNIIGILICGITGFLLGYIKGIMTKIKIITFHNKDIKETQNDHILNMFCLMLSFIIILFIIKIATPSVIFLLILSMGYVLAKNNRIL